MHLQGARLSIESVFDCNAHNVQFYSEMLTLLFQMGLYVHIAFKKSSITYYRTLRSFCLLYPFRYTCFSFTAKSKPPEISACFNLLVDVQCLSGNLFVPTGN